MKYILLIIATFSALGFQLLEANKSEIEKLYIEALNRRFDLLLSNGNKYVELNEVTFEIKNKISSNSIYKFLTIKGLVKVALREKRDLNVYRITHKEISKDTVDINFSHFNLIVKRKIHWNKGLKFKRVEYRLSCKETNGYEPDFRFIKNLETNNWELLKNKFLHEEK